MPGLKSVRDEDLLRQLLQLVKQSRGVEAEVVAHIGEVELGELVSELEPRPDVVPERPQAASAARAGQ